MSTSYSIADSAIAGNSSLLFRKNGKPDPRLIFINREPTSSKGGHFYLAWREDGKLKWSGAASSPRGALDAWHLKMRILAGDVEPHPEPKTAESKSPRCGDRPVEE